MSYAMVADAADELLGALRAARGDESVARRVEALARLARVLEGKTRAEAAQAVASAADNAPAHRMFGASMADLAEPIGLLRTIAEALGAKQAALTPLASIEEIANENAPMDARAIVIWLEERAACEAAEAARKDEERRAKVAAEREIGAAFGRRLAAAPQSRPALEAILKEMKARKPRLPAAAWKAAADVWVRRDESRSARAAREAIETKIARVSSPLSNRQAAERALAAGF